MKKETVNLLAHNLVAALGMCETLDDFAKKVVPVANQLFSHLVGSEFEGFIDGDYHAEPKAAEFARTSFVAKPNNQHFVFSSLGNTQITQIEIYLTGLAISLIEHIEGSSS